LFSGVSPDRHAYRDFGNKLGVGFCATSADTSRVPPMPPGAHREVSM